VQSEYFLPRFYLGMALEKKQGENISDERNQNLSFLSFFLHFFVLSFFKLTVLGRFLFPKKCAENKFRSFRFSSFFFFFSSFRRRCFPLGKKNPGTLPVKFLNSRKPLFSRNIFVKSTIMTLLYCLLMITGS
jgi:hypothetical protein